MKSTFLNEILASDFAFIKGSKLDNHLSGQIFQKRVNFSQTNLLFLHRDLSIWIKSLRVLSRSGGCVTILIQDPSVAELFEALVRDAGLTHKIFIAISAQQVQKKIINQQLIIFEDFHLSNNFLVRNLNNNVRITTRFSFKKEKATHGLYKIYSEISGFKKLIFLFLIIKNIFLIHAQAK